MDPETVERVKELVREANHWKAAHDNMVMRNALLRQRPDLPIERIQAYERVTRELDRLQGIENALLDYLAALARDEKEAIRNTWAHVVRLIVGQRSEDAHGTRRS